ncbi:hypothetical protein NEIELOOT_01206 [Neisseria elongata subsp. glycolytica ATCC 29315]|uniref:Uncharacterized protein n=2 Tax=Neisseria elongata subsp. glycolytica ATCC 29315 TaxID=546263 RepID=D4DQ69_NEIEG|nr:hypothetical protein NEIELOOT_01206 [Neisseria elongata subsp. glycolytica ATCC 29315]
MRRYRPAAMPHTVTTERKTMPNTRSPTGWYYCSYLLRLTLAGNPSVQDPEARFLSYENTVLIRADSSLEAYDKTPCLSAPIAVWKPTTKHRAYPRR